ncbi:MAG TPA: hypothetical protein VNZ45_03845, partial [Bacteroidia bacterium]|nr:hypothetical protein [Bacteroidia bacterium]
MSYASDAINVQVEGGSYVTNVQRATAGFKAPGQNLQWWTGMQSLTGSSTSIALYTVPTARTFYLTDLLISTDIASGSNTDVQLLNGTTASIVARGSTHSLAPFQMEALESQPTATAGSNLSILIGSSASIQHVWYSI